MRFAQCGNGQRADMKLTSCASSDGYMMRNGKQEYSMACLSINVRSVAKWSIREGLLPVKGASTFICGIPEECSAQEAEKLKRTVCTANTDGGGKRAKKNSTCGGKIKNSLFNRLVRPYKRFYRLLW